MKKLIPCFAAALLLLSTSAASAQEAEQTGKSGVGVGGEVTLTGIAGPTITYDAGIWRLAGLGLLQDDGDDTTLGLAGRFWYVINRGTSADFSVGGGLGLVNVADNTNIHIEGGAQIRVFLAPNVSLNATLGIGFVATDGSDFFGTDADLTGGFGISYFFY